MLPLIAGGIAAVTKGGIVGNVGGIVKGIGGALGIGGGTDPRKAQSKPASSFPAGSHVKLGAAGARHVPGATEAAPVAGNFVLDARDGTVYQVLSFGAYPIPDKWAQERKAVWQRAKLSGQLASVNVAAAAQSAGISPALLIGGAVAVLGLFLIMGRK